VTIRTREIYHSANGDRWLLALDSDTDRVFVRHEPNLPSGGQVADIELGAFLIGTGSGPEKQELLRLIGTLLKAPRPPAANDGPGLGTTHCCGASWLMEGASRADEKIRFTCEHVNAHVLKSPAGDGQEEADAKSA
jgi:hypothetical protein